MRTTLLDHRNKRVAAALLAGAVAGLFACGTAEAAPLSLTCPDQAGTATGWTKPSSPAEGFTGEGWQIFDGPPAEMALLAPERDRAGKQLYLLGNGTQTYLRCRFGRGEILERKIPVGLKSCELSYSGPAGNPRFTREVTCR